MALLSQALLYETVGGEGMSNQKSQAISLAQAQQVALRAERNILAT
jgi:hypothetical protein